LEVTLAPQVRIAVSEASQAGEARRVATRMAEAIGFDEQARGEVAIVATELATNLVRHARDGRLLIQALDLSCGRTMEILSVDAGPGMTDVPRCLRDGYSTAGTPGNGLGAVRRLSSVFDVHSTAGAGTVVVSRLCRPAGVLASRIAAPRYECAAISIPAPREQVCGDTWRIAERGGDCAVLVVDGLGHGPLAADAATRAGALFDETPFEDADVLIERTHRALAGTRGAALAVARIGAGVRFTGVGNISGVLAASERSRGLASQNGTVGLQIRKVLSFDYEWPPRGLLVMHSDGISSRWQLDTYPGLAQRHPAIIAGVLWRDFGRGRDDATIVVVSRPQAGPSHD
jgi:anti-sigma regulatory factor (Ser/Thr protein kinase)